MGEEAYNNAQWQFFICFFFPEKLHKLACDAKNAYKNMVRSIFI